MPAPEPKRSWFARHKILTGIGAFVAVGIGVLVWIFGKLASSGRTQDVGIGFVVWGIVAAALIAGAAGLIGWGAGLPLF